MSADDTTLLSLVYTSRAAAPFRETALTHLLEQARSLNGARDITGMLLYRGERFIQVLEGPAHLVRGLARTIGRDVRHRDMRILMEEPIEERQFEDWTMGYRSLQGERDHAPHGLPRFLRGPRGCRREIDHASRVGRAQPVVPGAGRSESRRLIVGRD